MFCVHERIAHGTLHTTHGTSHHHTWQEYTSHTQNIYKYPHNTQNMQTLCIMYTNVDAYMDHDRTNFLTEILLNIGNTKQPQKRQATHKHNNAYYTDSPQTTHETNETDTGWRRFLSSMHAHNSVANRPGGGMMAAFVPSLCTFCSVVLCVCTCVLSFTTNASVLLTQTQYTHYRKPKHIWFDTNSGGYVETLNFVQFSICIYFESIQKPRRKTDF